MIYSLCLGVLGFCLLLFLVNYHVGLEAVIDWNVSEEIENVSIPLDHFSKYGHEFDLKAENYLLVQRFQASQIAINTDAAKIYLFFMAFAATIGITAVSMIRKTLWYSVGATFFIGWLAFIKLDIIGFGGVNNDVLLGICLVSYIGTSYVFHAFATKAGLLTRLLTFTGITIALGVLMMSFSETKNTFIYLSNFGLGVPSIIGFLFILYVSYEIIRFFLAIITLSPSQDPKNNFLNFSIISWLYLGYLLVVYLGKTGLIDWEPSYYNPFYILLISTIVGIWGHKKHHEVHFTSIPHGPVGALLYIAAALVTMATLSYGFATANDPLAVVAGDVILYSHLIGGTVFYFYVLVNYRSPMNVNAPVHKTLYKHEMLVTFGFIPLAMLSGFFSLVLYKNKRPYYNWRAAYYNAKADVYVTEGSETDLILAKSYYEMGDRFSPKNNKSNYTLASIAFEKGAYRLSAEHMKRAMENTPTVYAYANLAEAYRRTGEIFKEAGILNEAVKAFPEEGRLYHNLGYRFQHMNIVDSSFIYYGRASEYLNKDLQGLAYANLLALLAQNNIVEGMDSLLAMPEMANNIYFQNNRLAVENLLHRHPQRTLDEAFTTDSLLTNEMVTYLVNYSYTRLGKNDQELKGVISKFLSVAENQPFHEYLRFALASLEFYDGNPEKAVGLMNETIAYTQESLTPYYENFTGTMLYKVDAIHKAMEYLAGATQRQRYQIINTAPSHYALAVAETQPDTVAIRVYSEVVSLDSTYSEEASLFIKALQTKNLDSVIAWKNDDEKTRWLGLNNGALEGNKALKVLESYQDNNEKGIAIGHLLERLIAQNQKAQVDSIWNMIPTSDVKPETVKELNFQYLGLLALRYDFRELLDRLNSQEHQIPNQRELYVPYYRAISLEALGDTAQAKTQYEEALRLQPYHPVVGIRASNFYGQWLKDYDKAYDIALQSLNKNPFSTELKKTYALAALKNNLFPFAQGAFEDLQEELPEKEFGEFEVQYRKVEEEILSEEF